MDPLELTLVRQHADDLHRDARRHRTLVAARCCRSTLTGRVRSSVGAAVSVVSNAGRAQAAECCA